MTIRRRATGPKGQTPPNAPTTRSASESGFQQAEEGVEKMPGEDARLANNVRREFVKRQVDSTRIDVHAGHGVITLRGVVRKLRGTTFDLRREVDIIKQNITHKYGVRHIVDELELRG
jgi:hypothetical protein